MSIVTNKDEDKCRLSQRINADLRAKMAESSKTTDDPDLIEDSEYVKDMKKTGKFGWVWIVLIILAVMSLISIILI